MKNGGVDILSIPRTNPPPSVQHCLQPTQYFYGLMQYSVDLGLINLAQAEDVTGDGTIKSKSIAKTMSKRQLNDFCNFIENFLDIPIKYDCTWAELFYTRMVRQQNILSVNHMQALRNLVNHYTEISPIKLKQAEAERFLNFVNSHLLDADGAIIGLCPSTTFLQNFQNFLKKLKENEVETIDDATKITRKQLLEKLINWAECDDEFTIGKKVKAFVTNLRYNCLINLSPGDLVIAKLPKRTIPKLQLLQKELELQHVIDGKTTQTENFMDQTTSMGTEFAVSRFCRRVGERIFVYENPEEREEVEAAIMDIFPFTSDMVELLTSVRGMKRLVEDQVDKLNLTLRDHVKDMVHQYLTENGIDVNLIQRMNSNEISVLDLMGINKVQKQLENSLDGQDDLSTRIEKHANTHIQLLKINFCATQIFHPTRSQISDDLSAWPYCSLAINRIKRYVGLCSSAMDQIGLEVKVCMNGTLKLKLSEWWLDLIRNGVKQVLKANKYNFTAINFDYIDSPPERLDVIHDNLEIIRRLLNPKTDDYGLVENLIAPLKKQIYPKLDEFKMKLVIVLCSQKFPTSSVETFNVSECREAIRNAKKLGKVRDDLSGTLLNLLKDIEYIEKMKLLEDEFNRNKRSLSDVVPVSGLVLNYFHRMEVELKTVLEIWETKGQRRMSPPYNSLSTTPGSPVFRSSDNLLESVGGGVVVPGVNPRLREGLKHTLRKKQLSVTKPDPSTQISKLTNEELSRLSEDEVKALFLKSVRSGVPLLPMNEGLKQSKQIEMASSSVQILYELVSDEPKLERKFSRTESLKTIAAFPSFYGSSHPVQAKPNMNSGRFKTPEPVFKPTTEIIKLTSEKPSTSSSDAVQSKLPDIKIKVNISGTDPVPKPIPPLSKSNYNDNFLIPTEPIIIKPISDTRLKSSEPMIIKPNSFRISADVVPPLDASFKPTIDNPSDVPSDNIIIKPFGESADTPARRTDILSRSTDSFKAPVDPVIIKPFNIDAPPIEPLTSPNEESNSELFEIQPEVVEVTVRTRKQCKNSRIRSQTADRYSTSFDKNAYKQLNS